MTKQSYIYGIRDGRGNLKIGKSDDVVSRMRQIQAGNPFGIKLVFCEAVPADVVYDVEAILHKRFAHYRMSGEWFTIPVAWLESALPDVVHGAEVSRSNMISPEDFGINTEDMSHYVSTYELLNGPNGYIYAQYPEVLDFKKGRKRALEDMLNIPKIPCTPKCGETCYHKRHDGRRKCIPVAYWLVIKDALDKFPSETLVTTGILAGFVGKLSAKQVAQYRWIPALIEAGILEKLGEAQLTEFRKTAGNNVIAGVTK